MGAISGIDIALWDLLGKAAHMPVCKLLGQHLDRVPSYASGGFYAPGKDLHKLEEELEHYKAQGYRDMKIKIGRTLERSNAPLAYMANQDCAVSVEEDYKRIEAAKQIVGSGKLLVDTNASWDAQTALSFAPELVRLGVAWLEEPIPFEDIEGMKKLNAAVPQLHVIGCETQQGVKNFQHMAQEDAISIVQPDVGWAGGITECRKIGAMAQAMSKPISLHCFGSAVLFAASLHLAAALPNTEMMESEENPNPLKTDIMKGSFETDSQMSFFVPEGDGLGVDLDWSKMEKYVIK